MELTPEKRLDKNGRLVTKHVRLSPAARTSKAFIPSPSATPPARSKRPPVARTRPILWDEYKSNCGADKALIKASNKHAPDLNYYVEASDVEAYSVMSVVAPRNVLPLLASGVRTAEEAVVFLEQHDLSHLIEDNSSLAAKALERNLPAKTVKAMQDSFPDAPADHPAYFDAMEAHAVKSYRESAHHPGIPQLILTGRINLDDLKALGASRIRAGGSSSTILDQLEKINNGQSRITVEELSQLIDKGSSDPSVVSPAMVNEPIRLADRLGADLVLRLDNPAQAAQLDGNLLDMGYDQSKLEAALLWNDKLRSSARLGYVPVPDIIALFEAGVSPEDAAPGLKDKLPAHQIIGIHQNGIAPSVSGGWL